jgi:hypothetical protein
VSNVFAIGLALRFGLQSVAVAIRRRWLYHRIIVRSESLSFGTRPPAVSRQQINLGDPIHVDKNTAAGVKVSYSRQPSHVEFEAVPRCAVPLIVNLGGGALQVSAPGAHTGRHRVEIDN